MTQPRSGVELETMTAAPARAPAHMTRPASDEPTPADLEAAPWFEAEGEGFDLEERQALRRVAGLATELEDVTEVEYRQLRLERVVLIGVWDPGTQADAENSLAELASLAETAGSQVLEGLVQRRAKPDAATYVGSGKARELRDVVVSTGADTVVCDGELAPGQLRQLEQIVKVKVIDRTALILDIFAQHATSREGKAQVELAQLSYLLPRLRGWGESMTRAGAGIGTRGPGETKIETDRRRIRSRMSRLRRDLAGMSTVRSTKRAGRHRAAVPSVAIVGYTNAGKSSLLNRLTGAGVLVEDALFATLDPTVRRAVPPDGRAVHPHRYRRFRPPPPAPTHRCVPFDLGGGRRGRPADARRRRRRFRSGVARSPPYVRCSTRSAQGRCQSCVVINKADAADPVTLSRLRGALPHAIVVSARTGQGLGDLVTEIEARAPHPPVEIQALVPYARGDLVARVHEIGEVLASDHTADGTLLRARVPAGLASVLKQFTPSSPAVAGVNGFSPESDLAQHGDNAP